MLRRFDVWMAQHRFWTAFMTALFFPVAVASTGVTFATADHGSWSLAAIALVVALGSVVVVGVGVRQATRRGDRGEIRPDAGDHGGH